MLLNSFVLIHILDALASPYSYPVSDQITYDVSIFEGAHIAQIFGFVFGNFS